MILPQKTRKGTKTVGAGGDLLMLVRFFRFMVLGLLLGSIGGGCASSGMRKFDAGPIASADHDVNGISRVRSFGPLIETQSRNDGMRFVAVRPFYSKIEDPINERAVSDYLWPFGMVKELKGEMDWRFFPSFGHDFDEFNSASRHQWSVFPLLFGGQGVDGDKYFAFFPLGGTLRDFVGIDRASFVAFPLYAYSEKDNNKTYSALWPIFSVTKGEGVNRWRVFPFYGVSRNDNRWTKRFVMWPLWTSVKYEYPTQKGGGFILWPLFGKVDVGDNYSRSILPPFFKWESGEDGHRALFCPWPIIRYKRGKVKQLYVWPLIGKKTIANDKSGFVLWPIGRWRKVIRPDHILRRATIMPFVTYESKTRVSEHVEVGDKNSEVIEDKVVEKGENVVFSRYFKFWPLFSYQRDEDVLRFRALALWPMKNPPAIERNWSPLWSLYSRVRNGERAETDILWGLYRRQRSDLGNRVSVFPLLQVKSTKPHEDNLGKRSWSLLYGLIGYKREGLQKQFKMLYFLKFGDLKQDKELVDQP